MSLMMMALRISAIQALKAADTIVQGNVLDSQIAAFDQTADGQLRTDVQRPFIAVYTDAAKSQEISSTSTGLRANGAVEILFNSGVTLTMAETDAETGVSEIIEGLPATDAHFEAVLDVIDVQIARALSDPENPWAQVFSDFVQSYVSKELVRSSSAVGSVRLAAGQTKLTVEVLADPKKGQVFQPESPWTRLLSLMEAASMPELALFQLLLEGGAVGDYAEFEQLTGMSARDAASLGLYAFDGVAKTVEVTSVTIDEGAG